MKIVYSHLMAASAGAAFAGFRHDHVEFGIWMLVAFLVILLLGFLRG